MHERDQLHHLLDGLIVRQGPLLGNVSDVGVETDAGDSAGSWSATLLLFEYGQRTFGIRAELVLRALAFRKPMALPEGCAAIQGVIQDRGTVIAVLRDPSGDPGALAEAELEPTRILVCATDQGHLGVPATLTRDVVLLQLRQPPGAGAVADSEFGPFTFLEPAALATRALGSS